VLKILFATWLIVSVASHFGSAFSRGLRRHDRWGLVPVWRYFVANSMRVEFSVVRQKPDASGAPSNVILPRFIKRSRFWWLWNPERLDSKGLIDVMFLAVQNGDERARRVLVGHLRHCDPAVDGAAESWIVTRKDNLDQTVVHIDTLA
jgi:hypothetical protein